MPAGGNAILSLTGFLIYKKTSEEIIFERTGTHSDLFE